MLPWQVVGWQGEPPREPRIDVCTPAAQQELRPPTDDGAGLGSAA